jgi:signal transduction histidine kinase
MGVKWMEEDIRRHGGRPEMLSTIADMRSSCDVAVTTLNEFLAYDKLEAGLFKLERDRLPAVAFIDEALGLFRRQVRAVVE